MKWFNIWFTNEIIVSLNNELSKNWECTFVSNDKEQNNEGILGDENTEEEVQEKSQDEIQTENDKPPKITCSSCGEENPKSITILLVQGVSMTSRAADDLAINQHAVNHWFTVEDFLEDETQREQVFKLMKI